MSINVKNIRNSLNELVDAVGELQQQPAPQPKILDRELSGNKINGGMITNLHQLVLKMSLQNKCYKYTMVEFL